MIKMTDAHGAKAAALLSLYRNAETVSPKENHRAVVAGKNVVLQMADYRSVLTCAAANLFEVLFVDHIPCACM